MSELAERANENVRVAERYAAELIDKLCVPHTYDEAVTMVAVAYLEGAAHELKRARDILRGDGTESDKAFRRFLRCVPDARGTSEDDDTMACGCASGSCYCDGPASIDGGAV